MKKLSMALLILPGLLFLLIGLQWIFTPGAAAKALGMDLLTGIGLSSQIGDMTAFFLALAVTIFTGVVTRNRTWILTAILLLSLAATFRTVAWLVHDAVFALQHISVELVISVVLFLASGVYCRDESTSEAAGSD